MWIGEQAALEPAVTGEEFACLSALAGLTYVPPGFCLTAPPHEVDGQGQLRPDGAGLARAYRQLAAGAGPDLPVVVRSRLTGAGPPPLSWVPAPWTFFNVAGIEAVTEAVVECLAPYASSRATSFRAAIQGPAVALRGTPMTWPGPPSEAQLAVHVQPFIPAAVCATVTSRAAADPDTVLIQARWGLPEDSPGPGGRDLVTLRRSDLVVTAEQTGVKDRMWAADAGGVTEVDVPAQLRAAACLSPGQARQLGELSLEAEARLGRPVEAEVLLAAGQMYLAWCHREGLGDQAASGAGPAREPG